MKAYYIDPILEFVAEVDFAGDYKQIYKWIDATTFDVVTKNGIYNGGSIAPGINLSIRSLIKSADQIPIFSIKKQKKIVGKNTVEALRSGFYFGYSTFPSMIFLFYDSIYIIF